MLREPLFHFLAIGALIFAAYGFFGADEGDTRRIEIGPGQIDRLTEVFAAQWRRPPTEAELGGLIDQQIEEEVLYREAVALGLDRDDTIVRRRLAQKMQFLIEDTAAAPEPTDAELEAFFDAHVADFQVAPYLSFTHVYFSSDRRADAQAHALRQLAGMVDVDRAPDRGDAFMLNYDYADVSRDDIARLFGVEFAERLFELPVGSWQGPVRSGYGFHLVRIVTKTVPPPPVYAEVRDAVLSAWLDAERRRTNTDTLEKIKASYEIVVAGRGAGPSSDGDAD
jgi:peptidyl-prolyl cis-trans isomerase C